MKKWFLFVMVIGAIGFYFDNILLGFDMKKIGVCTIFYLPTRRAPVTKISFHLPAVQGFDK